MKHWPWTWIWVFLFFRTLNEHMQLDRNWRFCFKEGYDNAPPLPFEDRGSTKVQVSQNRGMWVRVEDASMNCINSGLPDTVLEVSSANIIDRSRGSTHSTMTTHPHGTDSSARICQWHYPPLHETLKFVRGSNFSIFSHSHPWTSASNNYRSMLLPYSKDQTKNDRNQEFFGQQWTEP